MWKLEMIATHLSKRFSKVRDPTVFIEKMLLNTCVYFVPNAQGQSMRPFKYDKNSLMCRLL